MRAGERRVADRAARAGDEVDHARRQPGRLEELQQEVGAVGGGRGRLPDDGVPHQRGGGREVAGDRGEVERRDGEDETLERAVLHPVPDAGRGDRLLGVDPRHVLDVEAPEVDQLARRVDLRLVRGLRLAEHRRRVERLPPRPGEQLRRHGGRRRRDPPTASATSPPRPRRRPRSRARPRPRRPCARPRGRGSAGAASRPRRCRRCAPPRRRSRAGSRAPARRARRGGGEARRARGCPARSRAPAR